MPRQWQLIPSAVAELLNPPVRVFEADDIVFAQLRPGLHLNQLQRDCSRVPKAVNHAERDVSGLILAEKKRIFPSCHAPPAADDDPVLGVMMIHLQPEPAGGIHDYTLDLKSFAGIHALVASPQPIYPPVR
jgi:hypothetical protein